MPLALERKYPRAPRERGWQYVFAAGKLSADPRSGVKRRHHVGEKNLQDAVKAACRAGQSNQTRELPQPAAFVSTRLLEDGYDIRTIQELLGHKDVETTMI